MRSLTFLDRYLQSVRIRKAAKYIPPGSNILDIGCSAGSLWSYLQDRGMHGYVGLDPLAQPGSFTNGGRILQETFPAKSIAGQTFDVVVALAVLEHVPEEDLECFGRATLDVLPSGGLVVISVPHPLVDKIIDVLRFFRLVHADTLDQHHGFECANAIKLYEGLGAPLVRKETFQLGLNNVFVFQKK